MRLGIGICVTFAGWMVTLSASVSAQSMQYPQTTTLPPAVLRDSPLTSPSIGGMVPLNPATSQGIYPSSGPNSPYFDPYNTRPSYQVPLPSTTGPAYPPAYGSVAPYTGNRCPRQHLLACSAILPGATRRHLSIPTAHCPPRLCHPRDIRVFIQTVYHRDTRVSARAVHLAIIKAQFPATIHRAPIRILRRLRCFQPASLATTQVACSAA